jgi:hypothetical protein
VLVLASVGFSTPRTLLGWVLFVGLLMFAWWRIARVRRRARDYRDAQTGDATASFSPPGSPGWYPDANDPTSVRYYDGQNWTSNTKPRE